MLSRRAFLRSAAAAGSGMAGVAGLNDVLARALAVKVPRGARLRDIEHVVILMQENRSFDHYFGALRGVRGFGDKRVVRDASGRPAWDQADPDRLANPQGRVLPFRLDTRMTSGQCVSDQSHAWAAQQVSLNHGAMDRFVLAHQVGNGNGPASGALSMGYYTRADVPFHYALADAYTICDEYYCSVLGPTNPNRIMSMSGTVDPEARASTTANRVASSTGPHTPSGSSGLASTGSSIRRPTTTPTTCCRSSQGSTARSRARAWRHEPTP
jgi:phospholipase C